MLKNYFLTTWRNLKKNPIFSFINITGLAIGLTVCMFIVEYVAHENSYDKFHSNADRIYWIQTKVKLNTDSFFTSSIDYRLSGMAKEASPFVQSFLRMKHEDANAIVQSANDPSLKFAEPVFMFADTNFFRFFSFKLLQGNKETVLNNPSSVVITQQAARKYFGKENPVGKTLRYNNNYNFIVSGVAAALPSNSSIKFDFVAPISSLMSINHTKGSLPPNETNFTTYFLLNHPGNASRLESTLQRLDKDQQEQNQVFIRFLAIPFSDTHLNSNFGDAANTKYLRVFPFVAGLILLLALINYMSLSTARATIRAKEIGVRKVMGAGRATIAGQFFVESAVITACAFVLAYLLCLALQPAFFRYLEIGVDYSFLYSAPMLLAFASLFLVSVVLAATYPSLLLSAYQPVKVLYGRLSKQAGGMTVRRFFTVFQFTVSVVLIICGIVIHRQMYFIQHTDTGVNRSNVVMVPFTPLLGRHLAAFKAENEALSGIEQVSAAKYAMYKGYDISVIKPEKGDGYITYPALSVDQNFISMLGLQWKEPPLTPLYYREKNTSVINEAAVEKFGLGPRAVNKSMSGAFTVSGVLKDFNYQSLQGKIGPLVISFVNDNDSSSV